MKFMRNLFGIASLLVATTSFATESGHNLVPFDGKVYVASAGEVVLTFISKTASYSNDLYLTGLSTSILNNQTAISGTQYSLGSFAAGSELTFEMFVNNTGFRYFMGSGNLNPDGLVHASYEAIANSMVKLGFEDLHMGGDKDYDDLVFSLTNVSVASPVPEPGTIGLLLAGLGIVSVWRKRVG